MDSLSDDVFHHILTFIPSCKELSQLSVTSSRAYRYIHQSNRTDPLFRQLWFKKYQTKGSRRHYHSQHNLQQLLQCNPARKPATDATQRTRKAGLLTAAQEHAALLYDNGHENANAASGSMGYFGMELLWDYGGPVAIWGDFYGVRIFSGGTKGALQDRERSVVSIGEDESHVLCVQAVPEQKLIFLGFASGKVVCIQATWVDKHQYTYTCISSATKHTNEVTSLCMIGGSCELLSASVDGTVVKYPSATCPDNKSLDGAVTILQVGNPVLTMATMEHRGRTFLLTGDQGAHVSLWWEISDQEWRHSYARLDGQGVPTQSTLWLDGSDLYVIVGDNDGRLLTWRVDDHLELEWMGDSSEDFPCNKKASSPVECFSVEGNLLLVGAGKHTAVFELPNVVHSTPRFLGSLVCHPNAQRYASVVSCYLDHDRQSCVTLCRDGTLHEWSYRREEIVIRKKVKQEQLLAANKRKRDKAAASGGDRKVKTKLLLPQLKASRKRITSAERTSPRRRVNKQLPMSSRVATNKNVSLPQTTAKKDAAPVVDKKNVSEEGEEKKRALPQVEEKEKDKITLLPLFEGIEDVSSRVEDKEVQRSYAEDENAPSSQIGDEEYVLSRIEDKEPMSPQVNDKKALSQPVKGKKVLSPPVEDKKVLSPPIKDKKVLSPPVKDKKVLSPPVKDKKAVTLPVKGQKVLSRGKSKKHSLREDKPKSPRRQQQQDYSVEESLRPRKVNLTYADDDEDDLAVFDWSEIASEDENLDSNVAVLPLSEQLNIDVAAQQQFDAVKPPDCPLDMFMHSDEDEEHNVSMLIDSHIVATKGAVTKVDVFASKNSKALGLNPLDKFMNSASDKDVKVMRMRIIQAGVEHLKMGLETFVGVDNVTYGNIEDAFDQHGGIEPCKRCDSSYDCRMRLVHTTGLTFEKGQYEEKLLKMLLNAKNFGNFSIPKVEGRICDRCFATLKVDRKRCFVCLRWKDGKRGYITKGKALPKKSIVTPEASPEHEGDFKVVKSKVAQAPFAGTKVLTMTNSMDESTDSDSSNWSSESPECDDSSISGTLHAANEGDEVIVLPFHIDDSKLTGKVDQMWSCLKCSHFNNTRKFRCTKCRKSSGGPIFKVLVKTRKPAPRQVTQSLQQEPTSPIQDWDCQNCGSHNGASEYGCTDCGKNCALASIPKKIVRRRVTNAQKATMLMAKPLEKKTDTKWSCRKCTYVNGLGAVSCEVCHTTRRRVNATVEYTEKEIHI